MVTNVSGCDSATGTPICSAGYVMFTNGPSLSCVPPSTGYYSLNGESTPCLAPNSLSCEANGGNYATSCQSGSTLQYGVCNAPRAVGTYLPTYVASGCYTCPAPRAATCQGATTLTCLSGLTPVNKVCTHCPSGQYASGMTCIGCPTGSWTLAESSSCTPCPALSGSCNPATGQVLTCSQYSRKLVIYHLSDLPRLSKWSYPALPAFHANSPTG